MNTKLQLYLECENIYALLLLCLFSQTFYPFDNPLDFKKNGIGFSFVKNFKNELYVKKKKDLKLMHMPNRVNVIKLTALDFQIKMYMVA